MYKEYIKRWIDLFFGVVVFIILLIPLVIIGGLILITEGSPVLFKQIRVGQNGKLFFIYKFRTMVKNADKMGPTYTEGNDRRITRVGRLLRKTSLDELPQIINVIKGDMSFIGYRPGVFEETENYKDKKYLLKPGITGYAQVNGRSSLTLEEANFWENKYTEDVSFKVDIKIIIKTIKIVLFREGTN